VHERRRLLCNQRTGIYVDVITGEPLFTSLDKFDSGTGLPAFSKPISKNLLVENLDTSRDMQRTEVRAKRSNARLGYVFPEPKSPTGQSYTVYSAAFHFIPIACHAVVCSGKSTGASGHESAFDETRRCSARCAARVTQSGERSRRVGNKR
jgi:methionine-R-sulfoxide reductase